MLGQDFKYLADRRSPSHRRRAHYALLAAAIGIAAIALAASSRSDGDISKRAIPAADKTHDHIEKAAASARRYIALPLPPSNNAPTAEAPHGVTANPVKTLSLTVHPGDTLTSLLDQAGVGKATPLLIRADSEGNRLSRLRPGQKIEIALLHGELQRLDIPGGDTSIARFARDDGGGFQPTLVQRHYEHRLAQIHGTIKDSLFADGQKAGLSDARIMELADIFGWDIDFAQDIRPGDHFTVVLETLYNEHGEKVREGHILAAEFTTQGQRHIAIRYNKNGRTAYYSPDGRNLRKAFLRTPVAFTRISSRFGMRKHPILNRMRAHNGVDYAAPIGTPVRASGDGKIDFVGWKGGYGRVVILRHGRHYSTVYGHLSRFAHGLRAGATVKQGQVIAFVGRSGLATGPHLHYEFRVDGVHRNPLTVALPSAQPLPRSHMSDFQSRMRPLIAMLTTYRATAIAMNSPRP